MVDLLGRHTSAAEGGRTDRFHLFRCEGGVSQHLVKMGRHGREERDTVLGDQIDRVSAIPPGHENGLGADSERHQDVVDHPADVGHRVRSQRHIFTRQLMGPAEAVDLGEEPGLAVENPFWAAGGTGREQQKGGRSVFASGVGVGHRPS